MDNEDKIIAYLEKNYACYDRFTFDNHMRYLLRNGYGNEDALQMILAHCSLSALTFQERIHNNYYRKISLEESISKDLKKEITKEGNKLLNKRLRRSHRLN